MVNKKALILLLIFAIIIITMPFSTATANSPIIPVKGTITSTGVPVNEITKEVGDNTFKYLETTSTWNGGISGSTTGSQTQIIHHTTVAANKFTIVNVEVHFTTATVDGKTGQMTVEMNMIMFSASAVDNHGTWRIKDATGGLEGLHGEGVWLSAPNRYEGEVHFTS